MRTGIHTFSAADAFRRAGDLANRQTYGTGFLAYIAGNTLFFFPMDLHKAEPIEPAVDSTKRAEVLAKVRTRWKGSLFFLRKTGIRKRRSCTIPKGHNQPHTDRPRRLPNRKKNPSTPKGMWNPCLFKRAWSAPIGQDARAPGQE